MRLGVLDIGSNTGHLLVVDAHRGAAPSPAASSKQPLRLSEHIDADGNVSEAGVTALTSFVREASRLAAEKGCESLLAFATSALREAGNGERVLALVQERTGVTLDVLSGADEAALTFLAVRRWFGWSSGQLLVLDIGGGSLEIAAGPDEAPSVAQSLPLGAARLTRDRLSDPNLSRQEQVEALRLHVRAQIAREAGAVRRLGPMDHVVATSKTFRSLARISGAAPAGEGLRVRRTLTRTTLAAMISDLTQRTTAHIAELPGVSANRAHQIVAGAVVADAAMDLFDVDEVEICPWALREGVILQRLDTL